jgi:lipopolysaccharide biosynthesis regulator YciM
MTLAGLLAAAILGAVAGVLVTHRVLASRLANLRPPEQRHEALLAESLARLARRDRAGAAESLRRAAERRTDEPSLLLVLGDLYREEGELERARLVHRTLAARRDLEGPRLGAALLALARDELASGRPEEAERLLLRASQASPRDPEPLVELGLLLEGQGRWDEALEAGGRVRRLDGERGRTIIARRHVVRAQQKLAGGDALEARRSVEAALEARPGLAAAEILRGDLHYQEGRPERAAQCWEELLAREPDRAHLLLERLEAVHREAGNPEQTTRLAEALVERRPGDWRLLAYLAETSLEAGRREEADRWLARLAEHQPGPAPLDLLLCRRNLAFGFDAARARRRSERGGAGRGWATQYTCRRCGKSSEAFLWRCPSCRAWDRFD